MSLLRLFLLMGAALLVGACSDQSLQKFAGYAQGTTYHISYWSAEPVDHKTIQLGVIKEFGAIDKLLSNYREDSVIEAFNKAEARQSQATDPVIVSLVKTAKKVYQASAGCYDLTIKPLFDLWGFSGETPALVDVKAIDLALARVGMDKLEIIDATHLRKMRTDVIIDVSSIAQGYSVERIAQILEQNGISNYLVEIGGELKTRGHKPDGQAWRIAVERPLPGQQTLHKIITLPKDEAAAVMTSGTYRHYFDVDGKRYSHILDARNGRPVSHDLVSVTVIHPDPVLADAWSTALLCLGPQQGLAAANNNALAALFIEQQGDDLIESQSDALKAAKTLVIK
ncbi:MAG: FAD:protein FMN transferase [Gammaproteobacteria bacterium HGW-Gammaproteobacteria-3]|nr:MAG: FAD:protein FMN transferase [Gammaproteobacteria bacterium HGW-Gammaproteobacteria-3]